MRSGPGHLLVGFEGRANRAKFWLVPLIPLVLLLVFGAVAAWVNESFVGRGAGPALLMIVLGTPLVLFYMLVTVAVTVRRLHDREMDTRLVWLFVGVPYLLVALAAVLPTDNRLPSVIAQSAIGLALIGLWGWYIVVCGFLRGTYGPNAHGPDPLAPADRQSAGEAEAQPVRQSRPPRPSGPPRSARLKDMPREMRGIIHTLFGFTGRIGRATYWWTIVSIGLLQTAILFGIAGYFGWWTQAGIEATNAVRITFALVGLVFLWPTLAILVKRLNDRDRPAWIVAPMLLPSWINLAVTRNFAQFSVDTASTPPHELALALLSLVAFVYTFIELGCLRGTIGENRHGPDPVGEKVRSSSPSAPR